MNSMDTEARAGFDDDRKIITLPHGGRPGTTVSTGQETGPARLSEALQAADTGLSLGDRFFDTVVRAARQAGCELLFEIPSVLFGEDNSRAAVRNRTCDGDAGIFFVLFSEREGSVSIVESTEVRDNVIEFTRSYAGVLSLIRNDRELVTPLLQ